MRREGPLPPLESSNAERETERLSPYGTQLSSRDRTWYAPVIADYRRHFDDMQKHGRVDLEPSGSMAVLGMPLLAQLALRLISNIASPDELRKIVESPCTLYRALIDMTHEQAGKPVTSDLRAEDRHRLVGHGLRPLLWETARAITALGGEEISRKELKLRLTWDSLDDSLDLDQEIDEAIQENLISRLVISFFLKEGKHQGCRFLHKSFREYLFAEGVVEQLKRYGRKQEVAEAYLKNPTAGLTERQVYWMDFAEDDPRKSFVDGLAETWATTSLTREVQQYIRELLAWEIQRSDPGETARMVRAANRRNDIRTMERRARRPSRSPGLVG